MVRSMWAGAIAIVFAPAVALAQPYLIKNINPSGDSFAFGLTGFNGSLYFTADDGANGMELWRSDGTPAGTQMVVDLVSGPGSGFPAELTEFQGQLFFSGSDGVSGTELWATDGTAGGTHLVADTNPGPDSGNPSLLTPAGSTLYFNAINEFGLELWKSGGTGATTSMVKDIHVGDWSIPSGITELGGRVYFSADDKYTDGFGYDRELFTSDGTEAGTYRVKDIHVGPAASIPASLTRIGDVIVFQANDGVNGIELWRTDGTEAGTVMVKDLNPSGSGVPMNLTRIGNEVYFIGDNGVDGAELWKTDGSEAGTVQVANINPLGDSLPLYFTEFKDGVAFTADDGQHGIELWWSDGSEANTRMIKDIVAGEGISSPQDLTAAGDELYFVAIEPGDPDLGTNLTALWKTDGTEDGTVKIWEAPGQFWGYTITELTLVGDTLYFLAPTGVDDMGLSTDIELYALLIPEPAAGLMLLAGAALALRRRR